ncbi:TRAP transporter large permease [Desulfovermiculus halophilus]|uniref:TRAP transporter large permease n=1 Tax=Desulfovermiculus halophilus TaxID=339722 RepID=UPI00047F182B|nr:TRAP transporter large permease subunit [Desulfovermiculus halophilus]
MTASPEILLICLFAGLLLGLASGFPVPFVMLGSALLVGFAGAGDAFFNMLVLRVFETMHSYILVSIILFVFMGIMLERSGAAEKLFSALHLLLGSLRGGLGLAVIAVCTLMAAATGIMGAPVIVMGLFALPHMLSRNYDPALSSGSICAGGTLGILIPPSIMLIVYGPMAGISVGQLFMAAVLPGLLLAALYALYILTICFLKPELGPALPKSQRNVSLARKLLLVLTSMLPTILLIFSVLGTIFFGIAAPTEAAAVGALVSVLLAWGYGNLSWSVLKDAFVQTTVISSMILLIVAAAFVFTGTFMLLGGGFIVQDLLLNLPIGPWGILGIMTAAFFVFGLFMEWVGIVPILVPIFTPVLQKLGFDPLWTAMLFCVAMQTSFLTPPMAPALFYLKGVAPPQIRFGAHIIRGVLPFLLIQALALVLLAVWPGLALWLPSMMLR